MPKPMSYPQWLRMNRKLKEFTQEELAEKAGLGRTYINQIENGRIALPQRQTRLKIHDVLGTSEDELYDLNIVAVNQQTGEEYSPSASELERLRERKERAEREGLLERPAQSAQAAPDDPLAARFARLSPAAQDIALALIDGLIRLDEIPGGREIDRPAAEAAAGQRPERKQEP